MKGKDEERRMREGWGEKDEKRRMRREGWGEKMRREGWGERIKAWEDDEGCSSEYCSDERMQRWRGDWFSVTEIRLTRVRLDDVHWFEAKMSFMECMELEF